MKNSANKAGSNKLSSYEPGQIVRGIDLSAYRVTSKVAGPEGSVVKLANLQGEPVSIPADFTPVGTRMAHFASAMFFHLAYNRDFDLYVRAYCEREKLPIPVGPDGKPFRWADWLQSTIAPKLFLVSYPKNYEDAEAVKDEAIHEMLFTELGHRNILGKFKAAIKNFHKDIRSLPVEQQLTVYLTKTFRGRVEEMNRKIKGQTPPEEVSLFQPGNEGEEEEINILDTEEHAIDTSDFQSAEAERDIAKLREGFYVWLQKTQSQKSAKWFIKLFDIYTRWVSEAAEGTENEEGRPAWVPARRELEPAWEEETNLSKGSLYDYIGRLSKLLEQYISANRKQLGSNNTFVRLIDGIQHEREQLKKKKKPKQKAMPAHASLAALNIATEEKTSAYGAHTPPYKFTPPFDDLLKFIDNTNNEDLSTEELQRLLQNATEQIEAVEGKPDTNMTDMGLRLMNGICQGIIHTLSQRGISQKPKPEDRPWKPGYHAGNLGQCACEWEACPLTHPPAGCVNPASKIVRVLTHKTRLCQGCMDAVRDFLASEHGDVSLGPADLDADLFQIVSSDQGMEPLTGGSPAMSLEQLHEKTASTGANCLFVEWKPGEWYYVLERRGYEEDYQEPWDWRENADAYGPFKTEEEAEQHLDRNHANPGGWSRMPYKEGRQNDEVLTTLIAQAPKNTRDSRSGGFGRRGAQRPKTAKLVRGDELTPEMTAQIKSAFIYRWTVDNSQRTSVYKCDKCDIRNPHVNPSGTEGHSHPTIPLQTDDEWIREHAFYVTNDGRLMEGRSAEPIFMAKRSAEPLQQLRPDITPGDTGRLPHARKEGSEIEPAPLEVGFKDEQDRHEQGFDNCQHEWKPMVSDKESLIRNGYYTHMCQRCLLPGRDKEMVEQMTGKKFSAIPDADNTCDRCGAEMNTIERYCEECQKTAAGPMTPQQMQQQQVQQSQGVKPELQEQQQNPDDQQPAIAIMPQNSGTGEDQPMKHTVPPEIPNQRFHMGAKKTAWKLTYIYKDGQRVGEGFASQQDAQLKADNENLLIDADEGSFYDVREEEVPFEEYNAVVNHECDDRWENPCVVCGACLGPEEGESCPSCNALLCSGCQDEHMQKAHPETTTHTSSEDEPQIGTVDDIQFTMSGYQITTIDGHRYGTLFDLREMSVRVGSIVSYRVKGKCSLGIDLDYAEILEVENDDSIEKTSTLKTETDSPEMGQEVDQLIATHPATEAHKFVTSVFEHGQWWATCNCGAIWSVVDAEGGQSINGLDLEEIESGDGSCTEEYNHEHVSSSDDDAIFSDKKKFFESVRNKHHMK